MLKDEYLNPLLEFLEIPSISTQSTHLKDMETARRKLVEIFKSLGFKTEILPGEKHAAVFAERIENKKLPTVLVYGHYDVQPPEPLNEWETSPFAPKIQDGKVYARGATDNKGQLFAQIMAAKKLIGQRGSLPVNLKFIIEGEEEIGSPSIKSSVSKYQHFLASDLLVVSDSDMKKPGQPCINIGLRGLLYTEIFLETSKSDLHSGQFGGVAINPANILAQIISGLKNKDGKILIPGFYNSIEKNPSGIKTTEEENRLWFQPSLDVNGLTSGYQGEGSKTIIPARASAKISMRLVSGQNPNTIFSLYERYVKKLAPKEVKIKVIKHSESLPFSADTSHPYFKIMEKSLYTIFGNMPVYEASGGSIGAIPVISENLNVPCIMVGFGLPTENIHAPNEHFSLDNYSKGIETMAGFYTALGGIDK